MERFKHTLENNARILKSHVSKFALLGLFISLLAIIIATIAVAYQMTGKINIDSIILAQKSNVALWILNLSPILFMFWGQSISSVMSYTAGAMVMDQTNELRMQTSEMESKVRHDATHDKLTGLPNRQYFSELLNEAITNQRSDKGTLAIIAININNFKDLNSGFGNYNADRLLKQFAQRIVNSLPESCVLSRFGGDEFAILCPAMSKENCLDLVIKILRSVKINFALDDVFIEIAATAGVAYCPDHGQDPDTLIQRANLGIYHAKQMGKDMMVYDHTMDMGSPNKLILMSELKKAIDSEQILIFFQPKVDLATGMIKGCESLIRWEHPTFGMMSADKFIPIAEKTGLIKPLSLCVMKKVIHHASEWHKKGLNLEVSLNLSAMDIIDVDLPPILEAMLTSQQLPPSKLKLELIESASLTDHSRALEVINKLADLGIKISVDDFGTGFAPFVYLTNLPIHEIKIDKSFIMNMDEDKKKRSVVHAMITLANALNLTVVAEGVEKSSHVKALAELGCHLGQGYYFSEAIPPEAFQNLVAREVSLIAEEYQQTKAPIKKSKVV